MLLELTYQLLSPGRKPHAGEPHLPEREAQVDQHHPEVGGEVAGQIVPLEGSVQEPDLRVRRSQVHMDVSGLVNLGPVRPGRKDQADFPGALAAVQLEYFPAESELRVLRLARLRHSVLR